MIVMEDYHEQNNKVPSFRLLGFGLISISGVDPEGHFDVVFQKGIDFSLIKNILESCKEEIIEKKKGNSIIPMDDFMIFIHYFESNDGNISVMIYMDEKENKVNYAKLYLISKKINNYLKSNKSISEIKRFCNSAIEVPQVKDIMAIYIISSAGTPYYSKINKNITNIAKNEVHISGFISALFTFSQEIIGRDLRAKPKEITFGNQRFYIITQNNVIFAFLVEEINLLIKRYMYLIVNKFLDKYKENIINFNGDITQFEEFEEIINQYFII